MNAFPSHESHAMSEHQQQDERDRELMPPPPPKLPLQQRSIAVSFQSSNQWVGFHKDGSVPRQQHPYDGQSYNGEKQSNEPYASPNDVMEAQFQKNVSEQDQTETHRHSSLSPLRSQQIRRQSRYFTRDELLGQSKKTREIQPTSLFHTANQRVREEPQGCYDNDENAMHEGDHTFSHHYPEQELPEQDVSPVKTVIVTNKKRKRHSSNSTGTSTLVMNSTDSHAQDNSIPSKTFKDIIGHRSVKLRLEEIILPLKLPSELSMSVFRGIRSIPTSVLLMGPPGKYSFLMAIISLEIY